MPAVKEAPKEVVMTPGLEVVRANLDQTGPSLFSIGRLQAIVEEYRELNPHLTGVVDSGGRPVRMPQIPVPQKAVEILDKMMKPLIQDMCEDAMLAACDKVRAFKARSNLNGSDVVPAFDTALAVPRGDLTIRPAADRSNG